MLAIAALGISAGTGHAAPLAQPDSPDFGYEAHLDGDSVVTTIDAGAFRITDTGDVVEVVDEGGNVVAALPLTIRIGEAVYPIDVDLEARTLTLTPQIPDDVQAELKSSVEEGLVEQEGLDAPAQLDAPEPVEEEDVFDTQEERDRAALASFGSNLDLAVMIGGYLVGAIVAIVGLTTAGLPGAIAGFTAGDLIGTMLVGGVALAVLGTQYLITVNTPFEPPAAEPILEPEPAI
ncbi:hypothetical protein [Rhodococcus sp. WMMA185]|uniref:hypothetical protein n=1 Tax=Rhodococcus sp. WMMA185 TaxID=679318 RepID=UPI000AB6BF8C|nr:hypothetical protein [Rhodococcus sp. WMMA185]